MGGNKVKNDHGGGDELVSLLFILLLLDFVYCPVCPVLLYSILFYLFYCFVLSRDVSLRAFYQAL